MKTLTFIGHSDDLVGVDGDIPNADEYSVLSAQEGYLSGSVTLQSAEGRWEVIVIYNGCWTFAVGLVDEDDENTWVPNVTLTRVTGYSMQLAVECPDDVEMVVPYSWKR